MSLMLYIRNVSDRKHCCETYAFTDDDHLYMTDIRKDIRMDHLGTKELETDRLKLRRFELSDAVAVFNNWANDADVTKYLMWTAHKDVDETSSVLRSWIDQYKNDGSYQWAIELKSNGSDPIGSISVVKMDEKVKMVHFGYCIGKKWWHQGITSEAFLRSIYFFFDEVKVNRIEARCNPKNIYSAKVMEKCGLTYEGTIKQGDWNNQGICDYSIYGLVLEDHLKRIRRQ